MKLSARRVGRVLDAVYAPLPDDADWAVAVREAMGNLVDGEQRACSRFRWDSEAGVASMTAPIHSNTEALLGAWDGLFGNFTLEEHRQVFCGPPVQTLGEAFPDDGGPRRLAKASGGGDWLIMTALDTDGHGELLGYGVPGRLQLGREGAHTLRHLLAHMTAVARTRRARRPVEAVFSPDGRTLHAEPRSQPALEALRAMVRRADRARSSGDDGEALAGWTAVVQGRWSLVDDFEVDGRRFIVARENEPRAALRSAASAVTLSTLERNALALLARGHAMKAIAYELGVDPPRLSRVLSQVRRRLGLDTRAELLHVARLALGIAHGAGW